MCTYWLVLLQEVLTWHGGCNQVRHLFDKAGSKKSTLTGPWFQSHSQKSTYHSNYFLDRDSLDAQSVNSRI